MEVNMSYPEWSVSTHGQVDVTQIVKLMVEGANFPPPIVSMDKEQKTNKPAPTVVIKNDSRTNHNGPKKSVQATARRSLPLTYGMIIHNRLMMPGESKRSC
jgi:hypothetical protein